MYNIKLLDIFVFISTIQLTACVNPCQVKQTCGECISFKDKPCAWCEDVYYKATGKSYHKRCDLVINHENQNCNNITNPKSDYETLKNAALEGDVRVSPQSIKVKLRPGQKKTIPINVKTPVNFPVDIYYLMDLSKSMKDDLQQIKSLGHKLGTELKKVTENFRLGFGGFVDKNTGPYTKTGNVDITDILSDNETQRTFSYINYLELSNDSKRFEDTVNNVKISFNVDTPEGSLDALMQVIVCQGDIGWRNKKRARRIVIITTDATFHYSGDGLLGGFVRPNDGKCHMYNNIYNAWNKFDYPSLSQIRTYLFNNDIVPIFATTGNENLYKTVANFFGNGAQAEALAADSSNVVPLIKNAYDRIARTVSIDATPPAGVTASFSTQCGDEPTKSGHQCENLEIGEGVTFFVDLYAETCEVKDPRFTIKTSFDDVNVTLELICDCDCGKNLVINATQCMDRGNLSCGMCFCDKNYSGRFCQCTAEEARNQTRCKVGNAPICFDRGQCDCGECICDPPKPDDNGQYEYIYGNQCECSNMTCGRSNGFQICGGPDHGNCDCGKCICNENWTGPTCNEKCVKSIDPCYDPEDLTGQICNGRGTCKCGKCFCDEKEYIGQYCGECVSNCPDPCRDYKECVKCKVFETSDLNQQNCKIECEKWNITSYIVVDKVDDENRCLERDADDCSFVFTFKKDNITEEIALIVQRDRICPAEPDILAIILGVIAGIVGIGLALLLIWKLLATLQDRREFAKFENESHNPKWDSGENPIYKKATSTFQNPMYGEKGNDMNDHSNALIE